MQNPMDTIGSSIYMAALAAANSNCKCQTCQIMRKAGPALIQMYLKPPPKPNPTGPLGGGEQEVVEIPDEGEGE